MAAQNATARAQAVRADAETAVEPLGLLVEDVSVTPAGKRRLVKVLVDTDLDRAGSTGEDDTAVPPVDLDKVADATRAISQALDASNVMGEAPYVLEVSSPGTDRPLTLARHYRRNVGRTVALTLRDGSTVTGRVLAVHTAEPAADVVLLVAEGQKDEQQRTVPLEEIAKGRVEVEFTRASDDAQEEEH